MKNARNSEVKIDFSLCHYAHYLATSQCISIFNCCVMHTLTTSQLYQNYIDDIIIRTCHNMSNDFWCEKKKREIGENGNASKERW